MAEPPLGKLLDAEEYAARHDGELGFEAALIQARQNCNLRFLAARPSESILEVGCGPFLLAARAAACGISFGQWAIVEPAQSYAAAAAELLETGDQRLPGTRSNSRHLLVREGFEEITLQPQFYETGAMDQGPQRLRSINDRLSEPSVSFREGVGCGYQPHLDREQAVEGERVRHVDQNLPAASHRVDGGLEKSLGLGRLVKNGRDQGGVEAVRRQAFESGGALFEISPNNLDP